MYLAAFFGSLFVASAAPAEETVDLDQLTEECVAKLTPQGLSDDKRSAAAQTYVTLTDYLSRAGESGETLKVVRWTGPSYPNRCHRDAEPIEVVSMALVINEKGRVASAAVINSTNDCFEREALNTARKWRYESNGILTCQPGLLRFELAQ